MTVFVVCFVSQFEDIYFGVIKPKVSSAFHTQICWSCTLTLPFFNNVSLSSSTKFKLLSPAENERRCSFNYSTWSWWSQCLVKDTKTIHDFKFQQARLHIVGRKGCIERLGTKTGEQWMKPLDHHNNQTPFRVLDHPDHMTRKWIHLKGAFKELNLKDKFPVPHLITFVGYVLHTACTSSLRSERRQTNWDQNSSVYKTGFHRHKVEDQTKSFKK